MMSDSVAMQGFGIVIIGEDGVGVIGGTMLIGPDVFDGLMVMFEEGECPGFIITADGEPIPQD